MDAQFSVINITIKQKITGQEVLNVTDAQMPNRVLSNVSLVQISHTVMNLRLDSEEVSVKIPAADVKP